MPDQRFPILGTTVPPMLGRVTVVQRMINALTKAVPDHLQVVGPRFAGKTVILHSLTSQFRQSDSPYSAVVLWDLGHQTPATDELFMQRLARELSSALSQSHRDYAEHLEITQGNPYQEIAEVLDLLVADGKKVLAIMDGFDKPLSNGQLTRNLWDQLRELALKPSLRLVTASRRTLRDLIRHPDAQTSDFWNIFDPTPVRVGCFDDSDLSSILATVPNLDLAAGARTELWNASNGFPVLMLGILNELCDSGAPGLVSADRMKAACACVFPSLYDMVDALWIDCPPSSQDLLRLVLEHGAVARNGIPALDAEILIERGFVHFVANKLQRPSRMLCRFLEEQPNEGNSLSRFFGTKEGFQKNFKNVMERKIALLTGIDATLKRYFELGADDLPGHPDIFLTHVRGIVDKAFDLIWQAEIPNRRIPSDWMAIWKRNGEQRLQEWETTFPQGGSRVRLLNLMTGAGRSVPCAKYITRETYVLFNAVYAFGDFGQHQDGVRVDPGTAYAVLHLCVELAATLNRELPAGK